MESEYKLLHQEYEQFSDFLLTKSASFDICKTCKKGSLCPFYWHDQPSRLSVSGCDILNHSTEIELVKMVLVSVYTQMISIKSWPN